jgi:hypothetical protein
MPGLNTNILIYSGLILMLLYVLFFKVKNGRVIIDHVVLLFLGFSYYVYVPLYSFNKGSFINSYEADAFNKLNITDLNGFLVLFLGLIVTVCISDLRSKDMRLNPTKFGLPNLKLMKVLLSILIVLTLYSVYSLTPSTFSSYSTAHWKYRGPFISFLVILITMSSIYLSNKKSLKLLNIFTITAFLYTSFNLMTGNRGYFISFIISIVVVFSQLRNGIKFRNIIIIGLFGICLAGAVGTFRNQGIGIISSFTLIIHNIIYHFHAETNNVVMPLMIYLANHKPELIDLPNSILSQFVNIIPSVVFPSKFDLIVTDTRVTNFMAATHFYVMMMVNFGLIGSFLFMYFFVHVLNVIKIRYRFVGIYPALCAHIPFMFFRDFELTTVKFMFEFTFLFAVIVMLIGNTYRKFFMGKSNVLKVT